MDFSDFFSRTTFLSLQQEDFIIFFPQQSTAPIVSLTKEVTEIDATESPQ